MLPSVIYKVGVSVGLVDVEALLSLIWGDGGLVEAQSVCSDHDSNLG